MLWTKKMEILNCMENLSASSCVSCSQPPKSGCWWYLNRKNLFNLWSHISCTCKHRGGGESQDALGRDLWAVAAAQHSTLSTSPVAVLGLREVNVNIPRSIWQRSIGWQRGDPYDRTTVQEFAKIIQRYTNFYITIHYDIMVFASVFTHSGRCDIMTGDFGATDNSWSTWELGVTDGKAFLVPPDLLELVILASSLFIFFLRVFSTARSIKAHVSWDSTAFSMTVSEDSRALFLMR